MLYKKLMNKKNLKQIFVIFITLTFLVPMLGEFLIPKETAENEIIPIQFQKTNIITPEIEDEKLLIRYYTATFCTECVWQEKILNETVQGLNNTKLKIIIMDENPPSGKDAIVYKQFQRNVGQTFNGLTVIGNYYWRFGSGYRNGEQAEKEGVKQMICGLVNCTSTI